MFYLSLPGERASLDTAGGLGERRGWDGRFRTRYQVIDRWEPVVDFDGVMAETARSADILNRSEQGAGGWNPRYRQGIRDPKWDLYNQDAGPLC